MKKISRSILWILLMTAVVGFAHADTVKAGYWAGEDGDLYTYGKYKYSIDSDGSVIIWGYTGNETTVKIPAEIEGRPVRHVWGLMEYKGKGMYTYYKNNKTREIIVPDGVVSIGRFGDLYRGCVNVKQVILPDSVTKIYADTFGYCEKLETIRISRGLKEIGVCAFHKCKSLKRIELPDGLEKIDEDAFADCSALKEISIPDTVTTIGNEAFTSCENLKNVKLPQNLTVIKSNTFSMCYKLKEIKIPKSVKEIRTRAFANTGLTSVTIPENVTKIGRQAFAYNPHLKKITVRSKKIKSFEYKAFLTGSKSKVTIDVPNQCIKKYKRMLKKAKSFGGKMKIK
ncbi:MAG: leucine-rich repeat domain-containing protein [Lachnospiraceae bacterium]|nr:leucine-rich repeat domain-containing protein [Lachnospiraceae bacterium]